MEKSKLISVFIAKLKMAFPNYFKVLSNQQMLDLIALYQDMLGGYNEQILDKVAKDIIKTRKYMPSIAEIVELCDNTKIEVRNDIVEKMKEDGYFKSPNELDKIYMWLEEGIIPEWFKKDMMTYYNKMINKNKLIEG